MNIYRQHCPTCKTVLGEFAYPKEGDPPIFVRCTGCGNIWKIDFPEGSMPTLAERYVYVTREELRGGAPQPSRDANPLWCSRVNEVCPFRHTQGLRDCQGEEKCTIPKDVRAKGVPWVKDPVPPYHPPPR
jgi:hypothetical protein